MLSLLATLAIAHTHDGCIDGKSPPAVLSRPQLSTLISIAPQTSFRQVRHLIGDPGCQLYSPKGKRWAYPAIWDPSTWVVVNTDDWDRYQFYSFSLGHGGQL